jgi:LysM repeat protein
MGINKKILLIIFLFSVCFISAQTTTDTLIIKGMMFVRHIVKPNETYNSISKKYNVSTKELKLYNINSKIFYNQSLLIPIKSTLSERLLLKNKRTNNLFSIDSRRWKGSRENHTLNIAVLLPFYTTKNDSLLSFLSESQQPKEDIYKGSYMALNFLEGVIIATDSLNKTGMNINLFVYDTENDSVKVQQIINAGRLKNIDLIIGPVFRRNLSKVTKLYGRNQYKIIVSPLSRNTNVLKHGKNVYQIIPPFKVQIDKNSNYISKKHKNEKILILAKKEEEKYAKQYKSFFRKEKRKVKLCLFDGLNTITRDTLCKFLTNHKYIVLIPSTDRSFVTKTLTAMGTIDTNMTVFGLHNWRSFENLDIETLMKLNVHFPDPYYFDYQFPENKKFISLFKDRFHALPNKYAQMAFQQCMYFCFNKGDYKFKRYYTKGGFVNHHFPIVRYKDYTIVKVD